MKSHIPAESSFLERSQGDAFYKLVATEGERARNEPAHCKTSRRFWKHVQEGEG